MRTIRNERVAVKNIMRRVRSAVLVLLYFGALAVSAYCLYLDDQPELCAGVIFFAAVSLCMLLLEGHYLEDLTAMYNHHKTQEDRSLFDKQRHKDQK